jgi:hypothetical protein
LRLEIGRDGADRKTLARSIVKEKVTEAPTEQTIYISSTGPVLFAPFLPRLFERLDMLTTGSDGIAPIVTPGTVSRAVHLLQFLVDERCDRPEPDLVLNKLLCGVAPAVSVAPSIDPAENERVACGEVIEAVIANWSIICDTSPAGLRETFCRARRSADYWTRPPDVAGAAKAVDVLTDQIPWSHSPAYHRWTAEPIHVTW